MCGGKGEGPADGGEWRKPRISVEQDDLDLQRRLKAAAGLIVILGKHMPDSAFRREAEAAGTSA